MNHKRTLITILLCLTPIWLWANGEGSATVSLLANLDQYKSSRYNDCWGYTAPDGREYALLGVLGGTSIIDIADENNPREVVFIRSDFSEWKDIKTYGHYAYVCTETAAIVQIIDLSSLPNSARAINTYSGLETTPHNMFIDEEMAILYVAEDFNTNRAVVALSLQDPVNPVELSRFGPDSHDMFAQDSVLYVAEGSRPSIGIFDMRNPRNPKLLVRHNIPGGGYVHNVWVSEDNKIMMTTEETVGRSVKLWNIEDLENIDLLDDYLASERLAHNVYIKGNYAYVSHYADGLRILDITNPWSIREAGYYDTQIGGRINDGAWGAYPFFESGKILISDITTGLYIVRFNQFTVDVPEAPAAPTDFSLQQNYPNPFNPQTTIPFQLPESMDVKLEIYNASGQLVRTLIQGARDAGAHRVTWDGRGDVGGAVGSGVYVYRLLGEGFTLSRKMIYIR